MTLRNILELVDFKIAHTWIQRKQETERERENLPDHFSVSFCAKNYNTSWFRAMIFKYFN